MADNENIETTPETPESIQQNGIPVITMELNASNTIPNAVDTTLQNSGEAADAKTVGDRFETVTTSLNDALDSIDDLQDDMSGLLSTGGTIDQLDDKIDNTRTSLEQAISTAVDLRVPKTDISTTLDTAGKVADAKAVGDAIAALSGDSIPYEEGGTDTIRDTVDGLADNVETLSRRTGEDILLTTGGTENVTDAIERLDEASDRTANELLYEAGGGTIKAKVDGVENAMPFICHIPESLSLTRYTFNDNRITEDHVVASLTVEHPRDISWTTSSRALVLDCSSGIPEMDLVLSIPATNN